jgi:hypothetical protein
MEGRTENENQTLSLNGSEEKKGASGFVSLLSMLSLSKQSILLLFLFPLQKSV